MSKERPKEVSSWMTVLAVDAMHFYAAKQALVRATEATKAIGKAEMAVLATRKASTGSTNSTRLAS